MFLALKAVRSNIASIILVGSTLAVSWEIFTWSRTERYQSHFSKDTSVKNIWFIESANSRTLKFGQACAIESAALHNPGHTINLLTTKNLATNCEYCRILYMLPNFRTQKLDIARAFQSSPMEAWHRQGKYKKSEFWIEDLSDGLRSAILWKHGGIYLDLDLISIRSLNGLSNCLVMENTSRPTNSIMIFDKGHPFLKAAMELCAEYYTPGKWATCGPDLFQGMYENGSLPAGTVTYLKAETFLAINWPRWRLFFEAKSTVTVFQEVRQSYGFHVWNALSKNTMFQIGSGSAYELLALWNCPKSYKRLASMTPK